eukprot:scaffold99409_cov66-Phaeocystis_antarctica.AAC.4
MTRWRGANRAHVRLDGHEAQKWKAQHRAFPRGPPPQYYPGSDLLNFAVRMGSGSQADMGALKANIF